MLGDLVRSTAKGSNRSIPRSINKKKLIEKLLPHEVPIGAMTIHRGTCWRLESNFDDFLIGDVVEKLGWRHRQEGWELSVRKLRGNSIFKQQVRVYGAGTAIWVSWDAIYPTEFINRINKKQ